MEKVQLSLERFLPELRDLQRRHIFDADEITQIVAKRRSFEIALAKRDVKPGDYLRYIDYEAKLEKLRKVRVKRVIKSAASSSSSSTTTTATKGATKKSLSDHSILAHINQLYNLAVRRFPTSSTLWSSFIVHSFSQSSPLLISRTLSAAIQMNPLEVRYWLLAARFEEDGTESGLGGGNTEGARKLLMRALRFVKGVGRAEEADDEEEGKEGPEMQVWLEWIRIEVSFVERVRKRWELLGIGETVPAPLVGAAMEVDGEEAEEIRLPATKEGEAPVEQATSEAVLSGKEAILTGSIIKVVLDNCLQSQSHSLSTYRTLLSHLRRLPLLSLSNKPPSLLRHTLLSHIFASLSTNHPVTSSVESLQLVAERNLVELVDEYDGEGSTVELPSEKWVEAVGEAVEIWWEGVLDAGDGKKKGKGKALEKGTDGALHWEKFAEWLIELETRGNDDLDEFISLNLTRLFRKAPQTPSLGLLHLSYLASSPPSSDLTSVVSHLLALAKDPSTPSKDVERIYLALLSLSNMENEELYREAVRRLPFSSKLWESYSKWVEGSSGWTAEARSAWWRESIRSSLLNDAIPPTSFSAEEESAPRDLLPLLYLDSTPTPTPAALHSLLHDFPTLPVNFLRASPPSKETFELILSRLLFSSEEGGKEEEMTTWLEYAKYELREGRTEDGMRVLERGRKRGRKLGWEAELERRWGEMMS